MNHFPVDRLPRKRKRWIPGRKVLNLLLFIPAFFFMIALLWNWEISYPWHKISSDTISTLIEEETKTVDLAPVDGYYLGRGFIDGKSYYIFQTVNNRALSNMYILPVEQVTVLTESNENNLFAHIKTYLDETYNPKTRRKEEKERIEIDYVLYISDTNMKDYSVIKRETQQMITFIPFMFYYF